MGSAAAACVQTLFILAGALLARAEQVCSTPCAYACCCMPMASQLLSHISLLEEPYPSLVRSRKHPLPSPPLTTSDAEDSQVSPAWLHWDTSLRSSAHAGLVQ